MGGGIGVSPALGETGDRTFPQQHAVEGVAGNEHPLVAQFVGHQQVDRVVGVRQSLAVECLYRYIAIQAQRINVCAGLRHGGAVGVQTVDELLAAHAHDLAVQR